MDYQSSHLGWEKSKVVKYSGEKCTGNTIRFILLRSVSVSDVDIHKQTGIHHPSSETHLFSRLG